MSGIYIPGMKLPKGCATCPYCDRAWNKPKCKAKSVQGRFMEQRLNLDRTRQKWCPLVPVPDHGRLIDADETLAEAKRLSGPVTGDGWDNYGVYALIERQKTIVPADKGGEG